MLCPRCKRENSDGAAFCIHCGQRLVEVETARPRRVAALRPLLLVALALIVVAGGAAVGWYLTSRPGEQREVAGPPATLVPTPTETGAARVTASPQGATLELPPATGVESQPATITEVAEPPQPDTEVVFASPVFEVTGAGEILAAPARLTLPLLPEAMEQRDDQTLLTIAWWDGSQWLPIGGEVDDARQTISAEVRHLSLFTAIRLELPLLPRDTDHFRIIPVVLPQGYSVDELAGRLEAAWDRVIGEWGYGIPMHIQEGRRIQVWIVPWIPGQREGAVGEYLDRVEEWLMPYVNYDIYLEPELNDLLAEVTPAHEFYHIVQINSYLHPRLREDLRPVLWWMEATATWAGAKVLGDREPLELGRFHQGTASLLAASLDSREGSQRYAAGAFVRYLEEVHGAALIKETWDRLALNPVPLKAIDAALRAAGSSLEEAYLDFALQYGYLREPEWLQQTMNLAAHTRDLRGLAFRVETAPASTTITRPHLSGEVVALLTPAEESNLAFNLDWGDRGNAWRVSLCTENSDGGIETTDAAFPQTNYVLPLETAANQVVMVAANVSLDQDDATLGIGFLSQQPDLPAELSPTQPSTEAAGQGEVDLVAGRANEVILAIKNRDMETLAIFVHPTRGVRFSPYAVVQESDLVFMPDQIRGILADRTKHTWGVYDGTGFPMELAFEEYYEEFIYDQDFSNATEIGYNRIIHLGNFIDNSREFFPGAIVVEYHFPGFDLKLQGMDWESLRLVFQEEGETWYLVGIIHDEWTT